MACVVRQWVDWILSGVWHDIQETNKLLQRCAWDDAWRKKRGGERVCVCVCVCQGVPQARLNCFLFHVSACSHSHTHLWWLYCSSPERNVIGVDSLTAIRASAHVRPNYPTHWARVNGRECAERKTNTCVCCASVGFAPSFLTALIVCMCASLSLSLSFGGWPL